MPLDFTASGNPQGRTLMLIHPMGADKSFWDPCRAFWDSRYRSIACDLQGVGISPMPSSPLSMDGYAEAIEALAAKLGLGDIIVIGCAVGSMVAARYTARFSGRVAGLVMTNPGIFTRPAARDALAKRAAEVRLKGVAAVAPAVVEAAFQGQPDDANKARFAASFARQPPLAYAEAIDAMLDADIRPDLAGMDLPMLLVAGGLDRLLPPDHAEEIRTMKPEAEYVLMGDAAHFIPAQKPREFATLADAFIRRRCA